ncbi:MAG: alpha/beta hydrolase [Pseudomonadota bacterium]
MRKTLCTWLAISFMACCVGLAHAQTAPRVVDIPTRPGVTQRVLVLAPAEPKAVAILFTGGNGILQVADNGELRQGKGNFLIRSRQMFVDQGLMTVVVDAPSDRQTSPYLGGFRQTPEHLADIKAVIAWVRTQTGVPVWLVGTSRGTQSSAFVATELSGDPGKAGPDGLVLTSTILSDERGRAVPNMPLGKLRIPVLVVHHEQDGCRLCSFSEIPRLMDQLTGAPRKQLLSFKGGNNRGDPCEAFAYHGFNGLEAEVVTQTVAWMLAK